MPASQRIALESEAALTAYAGQVARAWQAQAIGPVLIGLIGELGAGKTTWVRAVLAGLGYQARVPSPTYTLLEHYTLAGLDVVHVDLYRLGGNDLDSMADGDLDALGLRDWLAVERCWVIVEWPERSPQLAARCDLVIELRNGANATSRDLTVASRSAIGDLLLAGLPSISEFGSS